MKKELFARISIFLSTFIKEVKKRELLEERKRKELENDIKLIKSILEKKENIFNTLLSKKLEERELILNSLLKEIDSNLENHEVLEALLKVFIIFVKKPLLTEKEIKALAVLSVHKILKEKTVLGYKCQKKEKGNVYKIKLY